MNDWPPKPQSTTSTFNVPNPNYNLFNPNQSRGVLPFFPVPLASNAYRETIFPEVISRQHENMGNMMLTWWEKWELPTPATINPKYVQHLQY